MGSQYDPVVCSATAANWRMNSVCIAGSRMDTVSFMIWTFPVLTTWRIFRVFGLSPETFGDEFTR